MGNGLCFSLATLNVMKYTYELEIEITADGFWIVLLGRENSKMIIWSKFNSSYNVYL